MSLSFLYRWANAFWIFDFFTFLKCPIPQMLYFVWIFVFFVNLGLNVNLKNRGRPKGGPKILVYIYIGVDYSRVNHSDSCQ